MNTEMTDPVLVEREQSPAEGVSAEVAVEATAEVQTAQEAAPAEPLPDAEPVQDEAPAEEVSEAPAAAGVADEPAEASADAAEPAAEAAETAEETAGPAAEEIPAETAEPDKEEAPVVADYSGYSRPSLVTLLEDMVENREVDTIRHDVDAIKVQFYKKLRQEQEQERKEFADAGNDPATFAQKEDALEARLKQILQVYRGKRAQLNETQEVEKQKNLEAKYAIIQSLKELVNGNESIGETFQTFRDLQARWREIGPVPQSEVKNLWETYHHHVENFYDYVKINKELRDLDLKRNLEAKIKLCERAEELLLEPSDVKAFNNLQQLHEQWREIGPVPQEMRVEIWERFKTASTTINKKYQQYFEDQKAAQQKNLEAKTALCEKVEEIAAAECSTRKEWEKRSKEIVELQKVWQTIGFATKKENNHIYNRFRSACDKFFAAKRAYFAQNKEEEENNLQLKEDLCNQAEALKDSTEWKTTTDEFIKLQQSWKEIGPVPKKQSEAIWKRFRSACDAFFEKKAAHFDSQENSYDANYKAKMALIEKIEAFTPSDDSDENIATLQDFQREWSEIGFVPMKVKAKVQDRYRAAIAAKFEALNLDEEKMQMVRYRSRMESMAGNAHTHRKVETERDKLFKKLQQLQNDIKVWENNIGFFSKSKNAEAMIANVQEMIEKGKAELKVLEEKIRMIDQMDEA